MKRLILLATLVSLLFCASGCGDGMAYTRREREHRWLTYFEDDMKQLNDDVDLFMLNDRPSRLSKWK